MKHHAFVVRPERFSTDRVRPGHQMFTILKEAYPGCQNIRIMLPSQYMLTADLSPCH